MERAAKTEIWEQVQEHGSEEEHGERKSWRLKIAGEGSDDWAPPEAEDMAPDLTRRFRGTRSWRKSGKGRRLGARVGRRRLGGG